MRVPKNSIDELYEHLLDLYREEHRDETWDLESFMAYSFPKFEWEIAQGNVRLDLQAVAWNALKRADARMTSSGKRFIDRERKRHTLGQLALDDDGGWLDVVVPLGKNERIRYGAVRFEQRKTISSLKESNFNRVRAAWREWEEDDAVLLPILKEGLSIEEAFHSGRLKRIPDLFTTEEN